MCGFQRNNYQANKFAFPINSENPPPYKLNQAYKTDRVSLKFHLCFLLKTNKMFLLPADEESIPITI